MSIVDQINLTVHIRIITSLSSSINFLVEMKSFASLFWKQESVIFVFLYCFFVFFRPL